MFVEFQTDDVSNLSDSLLVGHRHEPSMKSLGADFALDFFEYSSYYKYNNKYIIYIMQYTYIIQYIYIYSLLYI